MKSYWSFSALERSSRSNYVHQVRSLAHHHGEQGRLRAGVELAGQPQPLSDRLKAPQVSTGRCVRSWCTHVFHKLLHLRCFYVCRKQFLSAACAICCRYLEVDFKCAGKRFHLATLFLSVNCFAVLSSRAARYATPLLAFAGWHASIIWSRQ